MAGNAGALVGPRGSVQNVAFLRPSASPAPGGAHEGDRDRPIAAVGDWELETQSWGLDGLGLFLTSTWQPWL